jgi:aminoglycoside/choline kinase family phosphotransferase
MATPMAIQNNNVTREACIQAFLQTSGWGDAKRHPIPGDASFRRYERLEKNGAYAILMDAPPERENTSSFVNAQRYLRHAGFSVPALLAEQSQNGLLLLEDFGDISVSLRLRTHPEEEATIYADAVAVLADMAKQGLRLVADSGSQFVDYHSELLMQEAMLLAQWLLPEILPVDRVVEAVESYATVWQQLIASFDISAQVVTHRDYHADNLFLLAGKQGIARMGMLDFQDAVLGRPAYDLVSLLEDARRDVAADVVEQNLTAFASATGISADQLLLEYAFYGAQRNAKILGIFTRLYRRDGKPRYLAMLPRVWGYFEGNLRHPALSSLREWREKYITASVETRLLGLHHLLTDSL